MFHNNFGRLCTSFLRRMKALRTVVVKIFSHLEMLLPCSSHREGYGIVDLCGIPVVFNNLPEGAVVVQGGPTLLLPTRNLTLFFWWIAFIDLTGCSHRRLAA